MSGIDVELFHDFGDFGDDFGACCFDAEDLIGFDDGIGLGAGWVDAGDC